MHDAEPKRIGQDLLRERQFETHAVAKSRRQTARVKVQQQVSQALMFPQDVEKSRAVVEIEIVSLPFTLSDREECALGSMSLFFSAIASPCINGRAAPEAVPAKSVRRLKNGVSFRIIRRSMNHAGEGSEPFRIEAKNNIC